MKPALYFCLLALPVLVHAETKSAGTQSAAKPTAPWQHITAAKDASVYTYEKDGVSTPLPWLGDPRTEGARSPNKRWIHVQPAEGAYHLTASGAYPLDQSEGALLKGEGFLGNYQLMRRREAEDWKPLKTEEQRDFRDQLLRTAITAPTGILPGATPEAATERLKQLRESKEAADKEALSALEKSVIPAMDENYSEKTFPVSRRWAGWLDSSTGVYWDAAALEAGGSCQPIVQLVNYRTRTIVLHSVTLPQCRRFRALSPEARAKHFFVEAAPGAPKLGESESFKVILTDVPYPDAVRNLLRADLKTFIALQPTPEAKDKITALVKDTRKKIAYEQLPY